MHERGNIIHFGILLYLQSATGQRLVDVGDNSGRIGPVAKSADLQFLL